MLRSRWVVPLTVFLAVWTLATHPKYSVSGDEPHYLMVAEIMLRDCDLDLENDYAEVHGARFGHEHLTPGPHVRTERGGRLYPVHDIGVPVVLLPGYAVARSLGGFLPEAVIRRAHSNRGLLVYGLVS